MRLQGFKEFEDEVSRMRVLGFLGISVFRFQGLEVSRF
jgi:hypothetical protein